ncbi:hypothetical protein [Breznakia pachnodae]|uniref:Uncharacterized protein n=1 Tax=Breznakia pachnodae TaxID=265178 RepID=A0ABU0E4X0_9FIRM|nr:hypothetical protein [Breznakia pachnodae]MDQ0361860.1 hypothetical protein [Breznakia pachnodae]
MCCKKRNEKNESLRNKGSKIYIWILSISLILIPLIIFRLLFCIADVMGGERKLLYYLNTFQPNSLYFLLYSIIGLITIYFTRRFLLELLKNSIVKHISTTNIRLYSGLCLCDRVLPITVIIFMIFVKGTNLIISSDLSGLDDNAITIVTSVIGFTGVSLTVLQASSSLKRVSADKMHNSTEWRSNLMDIASKKKINLDDVLRVLSAMTPYKNNSDEQKKEKYNVNNMVDEIHDKIRDNTNLVYDRSCEGYHSIVFQEDASLVREYARVLLKLDWIINTNYRSRNELEKLVQIKELKKHFFISQNNRNE